MLAGHAWSSGGGKSDLYLTKTFLKVAVPELARFVVAPAVNPTVIQKGTHVKTTRSNSRNARSETYHW
jgi:hypothetical protein